MGKQSGSGSNNDGGILIGLAIIGLGIYGISKLFSKNKDDEKTYKSDRIKLSDYTGSSSSYTSSAYSTNHNNFRSVLGHSVICSYCGKDTSKSYHSSNCKYAYEDDDDD